MARIGGREFMELVELELGLEGRGRTEAFYRRISRTKRPKWMREKRQP